MARGPGGQEGEVRAICLEELQRHCDEVWTDRAGNVIRLFKGRKPDPDGEYAVRIIGNMDEIPMVSNWWSTARLKRVHRRWWNICKARKTRYRLEPLPNKKGGPLQASPHFSLSGCTQTL